MKALRVLAAFAVASIALVGLTTCKHDLPVIDIEGYWDLHLSEAGGQPLGFEVFYIQQTGTGLDCSHGFAGSINGADVYLQAGAAPAAVLSGTVSGEVIDGTFTGVPIGSGTGTFHMVRSEMTFGHLDLEGTCQGVPISLDTDYALGAGGVPDVAGTEFDLFHTDNVVRVWLSGGFPGATPPIGSYDWLVGLNWDSDAGPVSGDIRAESGTMTITRFDATGVAGEFSASFTGGDTITGSFDVSFNEWGWF